jgi:uncharacterized protein (DUF433 family)
VWAILRDSALTRAAVRMKFVHDPERLWRGWSATRDSGMMLFMTFTRITIDPAVCTGKPCIRGMRFPVARLLGLLAAGETREQILRAYPYLEPGDIDEALRYAAFLAEDETIELAATE